MRILPLTSAGRLLLSVLLLALLSGCALFRSGPDFATLSGEAVSETPSRTPIDQAARLEVQLLDVTEGRILVAQVSQRAEAGLPVPFTLQYDRSRIDPDRRYALSAALETRGVTRYVTPSPLPVLTFDAPTENVRLPLAPVTP